MRQVVNGYKAHLQTKKTIAGFVCLILLNKWGLDGNPAPFKIQYPMKNRSKNNTVRLTS
jgi:hypothetical protein